VIGSDADYEEETTEQEEETEQIETEIVYLN